MTTDPSSDVVERLIPHLRHHNGCAYERVMQRDDICRCGLDRHVGVIRATIERLSAERVQLREALTNAHARFGDIQHLNTHGMSNESYINSLRAIARDAQWELKIVLTAQASDAALSNTADTRA